MNRLKNFAQFTLTQQQQNNITGGNTYTRPAQIPAVMPATLTSSVNTWSTETITNQSSNSTSAICR